MAGACNGYGRPIYAFDAVESGINFNAIYDDMPMEGLWPWPKKSQEPNKILDQEASSKYAIANGSNRSWVDIRV